MPGQYLTSHDHRSAFLQVPIEEQPAFDWSKGIPRTRHSNERHETESTGGLVTKNCRIDMPLHNGMTTSKYREDNPDGYQDGLTVNGSMRAHIFRAGIEKRRSKISSEREKTLLLGTKDDQKVFNSSQNGLTISENTHLKLN